MTMWQAALILLLCFGTLRTAVSDQAEARPPPNQAFVAEHADRSGLPHAAQAEAVVTDPQIVTPAAAAEADVPALSDTHASGDTISSPETLPDGGTAATADSTAEDAAGAPSEGQAIAASARSLPFTLPEWDVIVIGAGLAGLKAAADLHASGHRVIVFEGRNRTGGRVFSTKLATSTYTVEAGAQWLHGAAATNPLYSLVTGSMGITPLLSDGDQSVRFTRNSSRVPGARVTEFNRRHTLFTNWAEARDFADTKSVQDALNDYINSASSGLSPNTAANILTKQGLAHTVNTNIEQEFGASASWLGYNTYDEGEALGRDYVMPRTSNLARIADYIASAVPPGFIKLAHDVTQVAHTPTGVTVKVTNRWGTYTFRAQAAVVTIPLGVLKARGTSFFSPALSTAKQDAISRLGVGLLNKVIMEFPASYANSGPFSSTVDGGAEWISRLPEPSGDVPPGLNGMWQEFFVLKNAVGAPILVAFQAGQPAVNAETSMTDAGMVASVMTQLRTWYGNSMPNPMPGRTLVTRWWRDPWAFGSYSYGSTRCTNDGNYQPKERQAFNTPNGRVWFAGEHVSTQSPATMQGAYVTGQAAAAAIIAAQIPKTPEPFG